MKLVFAFLQLPESSEAPESRRLSRRICRMVSSKSTPAMQANLQQPICPQTRSYRTRRPPLMAVPTIQPSLEANRVAWKVTSAQTNTHCPTAPPVHYHQTPPLIRWRARMGRARIQVTIPLTSITSRQRSFSPSYATRSVPPPQAQPVSTQTISPATSSKRPYSST